MGNHNRCMINVELGPVREIRNARSEVLSGKRPPPGPQGFDRMIAYQSSHNLPKRGIL